uniref:Uncharacterized protein n=1 Tax=Oryza brachyantha TaxID=4533 RepID=J3LIE1_ORYBR
MMASGFSSSSNRRLPSTNVDARHRKVGDPLPLILVPLIFAPLRTEQLWNVLMQAIISLYLYSFFLSESSFSCRSWRKVLFIVSWILGVYCHGAEVDRHCMGGAAPPMIATALILLVDFDLICAPIDFNINASISSSCASAIRDSEEVLLLSIISYSIQIFVWQNPTSWTCKLGRTVLASRYL